jgi:hypothetical protein
MRHIFFIVGAMTSLSAVAADHALMPSPATVHHGHFDASLKPVLTIKSGDTVTFEPADRCPRRAAQASTPIRDNAWAMHAASSAMRQPGGRS